MRVFAWVDEFCAINFAKSILPKFTISGYSGRANRYDFSSLCLTGENNFLVLVA